MNDFIELSLTCEHQAEAQKIADVLLAQHLVSCVKFEPIHSKFWWKGELEESDEIRLSMLSIAGNYDRIEAVIAGLHSYETFVLQAVPITKLNKAAAIWLTEHTK